MPQDQFDQRSPETRQKDKIALGVVGATAAAIIAFFAVFESEKSCYERLAADFQGVQDRMDRLAPSGGVTQLDISEYKLEAMNAEIRIGAIYRDNDQDACDYISDGPFLRRE